MDVFYSKNLLPQNKRLLSQRINELNINGKPAQFTDEEINTLNKAFKDISKKVGEFRISV